MNIRIFEMILRGGKLTRCEGKIIGSEMTQMESPWRPLCIKAK
jgi:hypothetical protein